MKDKFEEKLRDKYEQWRQKEEQFKAEQSSLSGATLKRKSSSSQLLERKGGFKKSSVYEAKIKEGRDTHRDPSRDLGERETDDHHIMTAESGPHETHTATTTATEATTTSQHREEEHSTHTDDKQESHTGELLAREETGRGTEHSAVTEKAS